jgi:hypothetical protein
LTRSEKERKITNCPGDRDFGGSHARGRAELEEGVMSASTVRVTWIAVVAALVVGALAQTSGALPITGTKPWVVVLCNFTDDTSTPQTTAFYEDMFDGAPNGDGLKEYFDDVSYGTLKIDGTIVRNWKTLSMTRYQYSGLNRFHKIETCAQAHDADVNYKNFFGVFVMTSFPVDGLPAAVTTTIPGGVADATTTSVTVASAAGFPAPPFAIVVDDGTANDVEEMNVTGVSGNVFTVVRGYEFGTANAHNANANVTLAFGPDYGNVGLDTVTFAVDGGTKLGNAVGGYTYNVAGAAHEMGHGFGFNHSRKLSDSVNDYNACWDIMSVFSCVYTFTGSFGGTNLGSGAAAAGDGFTAINVDLGGWLSPSRLFTHDNSACNQTTQTLAALNAPEAGTGSHPLAARIPDVQTIPIPNGMTTSSSHLWIEYRDMEEWDRAVPANAVVLHLRGGDNRPYWIDASGGGDGRLTNGEIYVDAGRKVFLAVNSIDAAADLARVTLAGCKIDTALDYVGPTSGEYTDSVTLAADLTVNGSGAPVPNANVTLSVGSQSCTDATNASGRAECSIALAQTPGGYTATAAYAGSDAYETASDSTAFTIEKEDAVLVYSGATTQDYHDAFTARATLTEDDGPGVSGKTVGFTLGLGDTCSASTNGSGVASCSIVPTQPAGNYSIVSSFAGDAFYEASGDADAFVITHEESTTTYTGPTVILAGTGATATLTATFVEDGANDDDGDGGPFPAFPAGQTITFTLGSQSCADMTDAAGVAQCTVTVPPSLGLGPKTVTTVFAGDAYYLPSSDTDNVIVFAFPSRGAFVLGDTTVAGAGPTTLVTWWSDEWSSLNALTGGAAPPSFKGFAGTVTTLPTTSPANVCGTSLRTLPGNSPPPVSGVPSYMGVLVAGSVTKSGNTINGVWGRIVVVRTGPGYSPSPGHAGTGQVVATFCP